MDLKKMKRGDIYFANLNSTMGSETQKIRPVLIVSSNANNNAASTITIISITSTLKKVYPFEVLLESKKIGLTKDCKAQCHQIRTISKLRISKSVPVGFVKHEEMVKINNAIRIHLDLD